MERSFTIDLRAISDFPMAGEIFVFTVTALTTIIAYEIGRRRLKLSRQSAVNAVCVLLECVGAFVLFLCVNIVLEVTIVLLIRSTSGYFVGFYGIDDVILLILSAAQGIAFRLWASLSHRERAPRSGG